MISEPQSQLFDNLNFLIVITTASDAETMLRCEGLLKVNSSNSVQIYSEDAEKIKRLQREAKTSDWFYDSFSRSTNGEIHFIISQTADFFFYNEVAFDLLIPVVTPEWVTDSIAKKMLLKPLPYSSNERHCLKDLEIYLSGYSLDESEQILYSCLIEYLGGTVTSTLSTNTKIIITKTSKDPVLSSVLKLKLPTIIKFVYPTWLTTSFKKNSMDDTETHEILPTDGTVKMKNLSKKLWSKNHSTKITHMTNIFQDRIFYISAELKIDSDINIFLSDILLSCSGSTCQRLDESAKTSAHIYLGYTNENEEYNMAKNRGIEAGNLVWLFQMLSCQKYIPPASNVIFEPFDKSKIFNKDTLIVSFSNFYGFQRSYIKLLTLMLGGVSTNELSKRNNFLISRFSRGRKYEAVQLHWKKTCQVVNIEWLEDCYKHKTLLDPNDAKFRNFNVSSSSKFLIQLSQDVEEKNVIEKNAGNTDITSAPSSESSPESDKSIEGESVAGMELINGNTKIDSKHKSYNVVDTYEPVVADMAVTEGPTEGQHFSTNVELATVGNNTEEGLLIIETNDSSHSKIGVETEDKLEPVEEIRESQIKRTVEKKDKLEKASTVAEDAPTANQEIESSVNFNSISDEENDILKGTAKVSSSSKQSLETDETLEKMINLIKKTEKSIKSNCSFPCDPTINDRILNIENIRTAETASQKQQPLSPTSVDKNREEISTHDAITIVNKAKRSVSRPVSSSKRRKTGEILTEGKVDELLRRFLTDDSDIENSFPIYDIRAVSTNCLENLKELDIKVLDVLGIKIFSNIDDTHNLNAIIAPKRLRTIKFLKSLSFNSLDYAITPGFINEILKSVYNTKNTTFDTLKIAHDKYAIPDMTSHVLETTKLSTKVFERGYLSNINIFHDIPGGAETIASILKSHGIKKVTVLPSNFGLDDLALNEIRDSDTNVPRCVIVSHKASQVSRFKRLVSTKGNREGFNALIVEWNWCVNCIFSLNVSFADTSNVLLRYE
ncbi:hypothetical protein KAFR_0B04270 [Kazachstania africana CBS 2517]|uniref:BRCT domain-containing protein n=1 Tax=Kazachstania africana (strain ATCC 22294 / BCRC 22015 / CBS 2517 / CECT 1963 / NBRC 1671 / NRRL Y-8276) TaxID=1071382 RepID=H2AQS3_KAZAF|nr:hypothetical protein KAFR_0B04270 [Kazachstania africana CBS 2517]CCF56723.1 hypothetical protein KAFR_0B04270 [Kazachstania africana CBS 2517]